MNPKRFRRSRLIILAAFLVSCSSVGYWFVYLSSHRGSSLVNVESFTNVDADSDLSAKHHVYRPKPLASDSYKQHQTIIMKDSSKPDKSDYDDDDNDDGQNDDYNSDDDVDSDTHEKEISLPVTRNSRPTVKASNDKKVFDYVDANEVHDDVDDDVSDKDFEMRGFLQGVEHKPKLDEKQSGGREKQEIADLDGEASSLVKPPSFNSLTTSGSTGEDDIYRKHSNTLKYHDGKPSRHSKPYKRLPHKRDESHDAEENDLQEVELDKDDEAVEPTKKTQEVKNRVFEVDSGIQASHLRSHNIPPIPRIPENVVEKQFEPPKLAASSSLPPFNDDLPVNDVESSRSGVEMSRYVIIHSNQASVVATNFHTVFSPLPDHIPLDAYKLISNSLPVDTSLRPSVGNGYIATVVHSKHMYMSGVYNGITSYSHRAEIPSTCSFTVSGTVPETKFNRTYELNMGSGIYSEIMQSDVYKLTQRIYAHRSLRNLIVVEVELERTVPLQPLELKVDLRQWMTSYDFTFLTHDTKRKEVSYKTGKLNAIETEVAEDVEVHLLYDHIPNSLVPSKSAIRTKWVFLTAIGTSKAEVEWFYDEGKKRIHNNDKLYATHVHAWSALWSRGRVDIDGDLQLAQAAYSSFYYLLSSLPIGRQSRFLGLSPGGLPLSTDKEENGRVTYHQELWVFPPLLLLHNDLSQHLIAARQRLFDAARFNAGELRRPGVMYPWQSGATGVELAADKARGAVSPYVSAGVVWAILQSVYANHRSHDVTNTSLHDVITDVSHFLVSKVSLVQNSSRYGVHDVLPIDESHGRVSNSAFVNAIVKVALSALQYIYSLENITTVDFLHFAEYMYIPVEDEVVHPAYDGYKLRDVTPQTDVVLLGYPLLIPMSVELRKSDLMQSELSLGDRSSPMTYAMNSVGWFEVGDRSKAELYLLKQLQFIKTPFQIWSNTSTSSTDDVAYNYLPAMGAFLQSVLNGMWGLRLRQDRLDMNVTLPVSVESLHLAGLDYLGNHIDLTATAHELSLTLASSESSASPLRVVVFDPEEVHALQLHAEIRFRRRRATLMSRALPLPES